MQANIKKALREALKMCDKYEKLLHKEPDNFSYEMSLKTIRNHILELREKTWNNQKKERDAMIFISGNVPSSKRQKFPDKYVKAYLRRHGIQKYNTVKKTIQGYVKKPCIFPFDDLKKEIKTDESQPVLVGFHFVRASKRKADWHNLIQILTDLMTCGGVINDDDMAHFYPVPLRINGTLCSYDKENPGVWIKQVNIDTIDDIRIIL